MNHLSLSILIFLGVFGCLEVVQSNSISQSVSSTKEYLFKQLRDGLISKSTVMSTLEETIARIKFKYQTAKTSGELVGADEAECSAFYYRLVIDEVRKLRERYPQPKEEVPEGNAANRFASACKKCIGSIDSKLASQFDLMDLEDEEEDLQNELDTLDSLENEAEMGWSMDAESKAALKDRTLSVLGDLVQNELKVLATIIITSYLGGGVPATAIGQVMGSVSVSIKSKLLEFLMHTIMDLFASALGKKIDPELPKTSISLPKEEKKQDNNVEEQLAMA